MMKNKMTTGCLIPAYPASLRRIIFLNAEVQKCFTKR